jgi:hypothetical protein
MQGFVSDRAGGTARPPSANSNRQRRAPQKMPVPKTSLSNEPVQISAAAHRTLGNQLNYSADQLQNGPQQDSRATPRGRYDTDAGSSIDTTINDRSTLNGADGQQIQKQQFAPADPPYEDQDFEDRQSSSGSSDGDSETERDDGQDEVQDEDQDEDQVRHQYQGQDLEEFHDEAQDELEAIGIFVDGDSYPSTTSGLPEGHFDQRSLKQQKPASRVGHDHLGALHFPQPAQGSITTRHTQPTFQRANPSVTGPPAMSAPNLFKKGAAVRESEQRVNAPRDLPRGAVRQANAAPISSQLPSNARTVPQASRQEKGVPGPQTSAPVSQTSRHEAPPSKQTHVATTTPVLPLRSALPQTHLPLKEDPAVPYRSVEEDPSHEPEGPIGDYETPYLFNMKYDELRAEDFDTEPRGKTQVLSNDMHSRELEQRLVYVQKNLDLGDQDKFFRALPTREWEEAGDWFLDRFGSIIKRAKEARQNKRKLAREFEDEVEKRYRKVAKKQQNVEAALGEMKEKGQGLIPKSPRASRDPASKTPRSRKR